jgi:SAM-dependent methyltransferase
MLESNVSKALFQIASGYKVLDIGGWAMPFNRADYVLDIQPYETRGMFGSLGPGPERFTRDCWIVRDICDHTPYPFPDKFFDYVICSHTLEDIRDPIFVCSEMNRIGKRGYIEVPSMLEELCMGVEHRRYAGRSHHRWLTNIAGNEIVLTLKYHSIHSYWKYHLPRRRATALSPGERVQFLFWAGHFNYREQVLITWKEIDNYLTSSVRAYKGYPSWQYSLDGAMRRLYAAASRLVKRRVNGRD